MSAAAESVLVRLRFGGGKRLPVILQTGAAACAGTLALPWWRATYGYEIPRLGCGARRDWAQLRSRSSSRLWCLNCRLRVPRPPVPQSVGYLLADGASD